MRCLCATESYNEIRSDFMPFKYCCNSFAVCRGSAVLVGSAAALIHGLSRQRFMLNCEHCSHDYQSGLGAGGLLLKLQAASAVPKAKHCIMTHSGPRVTMGGPGQCVCL